MLCRISPVARLAKAGLAAATLIGLAALAATPAAAAGWSANGTKILMPSGSTYLITGVNWYGAETTTNGPNGLYNQDLTYIINLCKQYGFNTIRIPICDQNWRTDPVPNTANCPTCGGRRLRDILALIVNYAGSVGLHVILDNHRSEAGNSAEANGLWYTSAYPESTWISDWVSVQQWAHGIPQTIGATDTVTCNYLASDGAPIVIGYDLRNEPHLTTNRNGAVTGGSTWGTGDGIDPNVNPNPNPFAITNTSSPTDWRLAAERCGDTLLGDAASHGWDYPIVFVEGTGMYPTATGNWTSGPFNSTWWGGELLGVNGNAGHPGAPVVLNAGGNAASLGSAVGNHLVYSPHEYGPVLFKQSWFNTGTTYKSGSGPSALADVWALHWAYLTYGSAINPAWAGHASYPWSNTGTTPYGATPVWIGEFGTGNSTGDLYYSGNGSQGQWFTDLINFIQSSRASTKTAANDSGTPVADLNYTYWALNGEDSYSVLDKRYSAIANPAKDYSFLCFVSGMPGSQCGSTGVLPLPQ